MPSISHGIVRDIRFIFLITIGGLSLLSCDHLDRSAGGQKITPAPQSGPATPQQPSGPIQISPLKEYSLVGESSLQTSSSAVSGAGRFVFKEPLKFSDNNFALSFSLNPEGALTLFVATDAALENGASLRFSRKSDDTLLVQLTRGPESYDLSADFAAIASNSPLNIEVDVNAHGHLIVWIGNTEIGQYAFSLPLAQKLWGLALDKAIVTKADVGPSKVEG